MHAQRYSSPVAINRMRDGMCPECGASAESHTDSVVFWVPRRNDCSLLPRGVTERVEYQRRIDAGEETD